MNSVIEDKTTEEAKESKNIRSLTEIQSDFETVGKVLIKLGLYDSYNFLNSSHRVFVAEVIRKSRKNEK